MDYDDIVEAHYMAMEHEYEPTQLHLGQKEIADLLEDSNFMADTSDGGTYSQIGMIGGIDVNRTPANSMRLMMAQDGDNVGYYLF